LGFACCRYALNVYFNLLNKSIFKYFPFPYTVSSIHVIVGTAYCVLVYILGFKKASFGRVRQQRTWGSWQQHAPACAGTCRHPEPDLCPSRACWGDGRHYVGAGAGPNTFMY